MNKIAAALLLSLGMTSVQAVPIVFTSSTYTTSGLAEVDNVADGPDSATAILPPDTLPISSSASVSVVGGSADAGAVADNLSLTASTDASSAGGLATADAVTTFFGMFITPGGLLSLSVDFENTALTGGNGLVDSTLAVSLTVDGSPLFDQSFSSTALIDRDFLVPAGLLGELELALVSFASSSADGDTASNLVTASFVADAVAVPEPATLALIFAGLWLLGLGHRFGVARARYLPSEKIL